MVHVDEPDIFGLYHELIMAVENKYKGETRHQTALRYIKNGQIDYGSKKCYTNHSLGVMVNKPMGGGSPLPPTPYIDED